MKRLKFILPIVFLVIGVIAVKALGSRDRAPKKSVTGERSVAVETIRVNRVDEDFWVSAQGTVKAVQNTALSAQVSGKVVGLNTKLKSGGRFEKGETMLRLDSRDYRARLVQAEAQVQRAQMEFELAGQRRRVAQAEYASSGLAQKGPAHPLSQHEPQIRAAEAALASARAGRDLARLAVERTVLHAPYDCLVRKRSVEIGDVVGPGRQLVMVAGTSTYEVVISLGQDRLSLIQAGGNLEQRTVEIEITGGDGSARWKGRFDRLEGEVEPLGRLARLVVRIDTPLSGDKPLFLGSFVRVKIAGTPLKNIFVVPDRAFNGGRVFVVDEKGRLAARSLTIVHRVPGKAYVTEGLNDDDELVISRLRNPLVGMKVRRHGEGEEQAKTKPAEGENK